MSTTFPTLTPIRPANITEEYKVLKNDFGDGYTQRIGDGINTIREKIDIEFIVDNTDRNTIRTFLRARGGYESFLLPSVIYTPLGLTSTTLWTCEKFPSEYSTYDDGSSQVWHITISLTKEFDLV